MAQVFSCQFCENFIFFTKCLQMAASAFTLNSTRFQHLLRYPALVDWTTCSCNLITEFVTSLRKEQLKPNYEKTLMHP